VRLPQEKHRGAGRNSLKNMAYSINVFGPSYTNLAGQFLPAPATFFFLHHTLL